MNALQSDMILGDEEDMDYEAEIAFHSVLILGSLESREIRNARRREHRYYLTRPDLLPNPRVGTV